MTETSERGLALSKKIAQIYSECSQVKSIVAGGSVARGYADGYSDVDIFVFCDDFPSEKERASAVERVHGEGWKSHSDRIEQGLARDCYRTEDARIDVGLYKISSVEKVLVDVLEQYDITPYKQGFFGGLLDALPLYGEQQIHTWQIRAALYPDGLLQAMVNTHLHIDPLWIPEICALERGDLLYLYDAFCQAQKKVICILLGLNRLYQPAEFKRVDRLISRMQLAPFNLSCRLNEIFGMEVRDAVRSLSALVEETFDLVERHLPAVDVGFARLNFTTDTDTEE